MKKITIRKVVALITVLTTLFALTACGNSDIGSNTTAQNNETNNETAETYLTENYPDIPLQKYDSYAAAKNALENGNGIAWANDNTEVIAFELQNEGYSVGISEFGNKAAIAPAVSKGNETLQKWINYEIIFLAAEQFFHADYDATLAETYGDEYKEQLVVEGGGEAAGN